MAILQERIKLRDDQLSNKFNSTPPDEAKEIIKKLTDKLAKLLPRQLTEEQQKIIAQNINISDKYTIEIGHDMSCSDECISFVKQLSIIFSNNPAWSVQNSAVLGPSLLSPTGFGLYVSNPSSLSRPETIVSNALKAAAVSFDVLPYPYNKRSDVRIVITTAK